MDNYLKVSSKIYSLRKFLEGSQGDAFERKIYLQMLELEDNLGITQCYNCGEYDFIHKMKKVDNTIDGVDLYCKYCVSGYEED